MSEHKAAFRVTFYSYRGGVGRTRALLNVASILAQAGRRVVAVDMDLAAPGFDRSGLVPFRPRPRGVSDFCFDHLLPDEGLPMEDYLCPVGRPEASGPGGLWLMTAGRRAQELVAQIPSIYADPAGDSARIFELLVVKLEAHIRPDYIFFDSRTGLADIAGVSTIELPELLVAVCGLSEQNVSGMKRVLDELRTHEARAQPLAMILALRPVPRDRDLKLQPLRELVGSAAGLRAPLEDEPALQSHPLFQRVFEAQKRLLVPIIVDSERWGPLFSRLKAPRDLFHTLEYDPMVPVVGELSTNPSATLYRQYQRLARSVSLAHPTDAIYDAGDWDPDLCLPALVSM